MSTPMMAGATINRRRSKAPRENPCGSAATMRPLGAGANTRDIVAARRAAEEPSGRLRRGCADVDGDAAERVGEVGWSNRLRQIVVHPRGQAALAVALHCVRRHRDDRYSMSGGFAR